MAISSATCSMRRRGAFTISSVCGAKPDVLMSRRSRSDLSSQISNLKVQICLSARGRVHQLIFETRIVIEIVALSDAMREAVGLAERGAITDANVLVTGESGSGKDALAWFIHSRSRRAGQTLVKIDCATLPADLLEAELFGYERGAFTGATEAKPGRLEAAHRGPLVLDAIAHRSPDAQAKVVRGIQHAEV